MAGKYRPFESAAKYFERWNDYDPDKELATLTEQEQIEAAAAEVPIPRQGGEARNGAPTACTDPPEWL